MITLFIRMCMCVCDGGLEIVFVNVHSIIQVVRVRTGEHRGCLRGWIFFYIRRYVMVGLKLS